MLHRSFSNMFDVSFSIWSCHSVAFKRFVAQRIDSVRSKTYFSLSHSLWAAAAHRSILPIFCVQSSKTIFVSSLCATHTHSVCAFIFFFLKFARCYLIQIKSSCNSFNNFLMHTHFPSATQIIIARYWECVCVVFFFATFFSLLFFRYISL